MVNKLSYLPAIESILPKPTQGIYLKLGDYNCTFPFERCNYSVIILIGEFAAIHVCDVMSSTDSRTVSNDSFC